MFLFLNLGILLARFLSETVVLSAWQLLVKVDNIGGQSYGVKQFVTGVFNRALETRLYTVVFQDLLAGGSVLRLHLQQQAQHVTQLLRVALSDGCELAAADLFVQGLPFIIFKGYHTCLCRRRGVSKHIARRCCYLHKIHAAQGPDVALRVVRLVHPDLGTGVVGRAGLRQHET